VSEQLIVPRLGTEWEGQGGLNAGLMRGENGAPDYYLIAPTTSLALKASIAYGGYGKKTEGADSILDGFANTQALVNSGNDHPAAQWAARLAIDGFSDFFIPSIMELALLRVMVPDLFGDYWYVSSTQYSAGYAWNQYFVDGSQIIAYKLSEGRFRAVRRFIPQ
jgi:hypothetical protein